MALILITDENHRTPPVSTLMNHISIESQHCGVVALILITDDNHSHDAVILNSDEISGHDSTRLITDDNHSHVGVSTLMRMSSRHHPSETGGVVPRDSQQ